MYSMLRWATWAPPLDPYTSRFVSGSVVSCVMITGMLFESRYLLHFKMVGNKDRVCGRGGWDEGLGLVRWWRLQRLDVEILGSYRGQHGFQDGHLEPLSRGPNRNMFTLITIEILLKIMPLTEHGVQPEDIALTCHQRLTTVTS